MDSWVVRLIEQSGYLGVGFLMFLETVFPPIPSEVIMPVAGVAAAARSAKTISSRSPTTFAPATSVRASAAGSSSDRW